MRILHIVDQISQQFAGGSARVPFQLSAAQAKLGHDVTIYTSDYSAKAQPPPKGVKLVKYHCVVNILGGAKVTPGMLLANYNQFDIVHLHNYRTFQNLIHPPTSGPPYLIQAHGNLLPLARFTLAHNFIWRNMILRNARRCISSSSSETQYYIEEKVNPAKIIEVPIGIDLAEFEDLPERKNGTQKQVLFLARLDKIKGLDLLIQAMKYTTDIKLIVAGMDYGYGDEAKQLVEYLGLKEKVQFIGPVFGRDKLQAYVDADIFIIPSKYESWGLTFMEALACGTPVIMTRNCAASGVIKYPLGGVCASDPVVIAVLIKYMLANDYRNKNIEYRKTWVRDYSWQALAPKYIDVYKQILQEGVLRYD